MYIFYSCKIRHSFNDYKLISIENKELQYDKVTKFFFEQIKDEIKSRNITILDSGYSSKHLFFVVTEKEAFNAVKSMCSRSFSRYKIEEQKNDYITTYHINIEIKNIDNLVKELSHQSIYPIYKASKTFPKSEGNILYVKFYDDKVIEKFKNLVQQNNIMNVRFVGYGNEMLTYEGKSIKVSDPIFRDFFGHNLVDKFSLHEDIIVMHLSAFAIGELNNLKVNGGGNICFESGGVVYSQMSLREGKPVRKDLQFVKCQSKKEALELMNKLSLGGFNAFTIKEEKTVYSNLKAMFYIMCALIIAIFVYLCSKVRNKKTIIALIISNIAFSYFSYMNSFYDLNFLITMIIQQLVFYIINEKEGEIKLFGFYLTLIYFAINLFVFGLSSIFNNYFFEFLTNRSIVSSFTIFVSYSIIQAIKTKKEEIMTKI